MDVGCFIGVLGAEQHTTHIRLSSYVRSLIDRYRGLGFTPRAEWIVEQAIEGLLLLR